MDLHGPTRTLENIRTYTNVINIYTDGARSASDRAASAFHIPLYGVTVGLGITSYDVRSEAVGNLHLPTEDQQRRSAKIRHIQRLCRHSTVDKINIDNSSTSPTYRRVGGPTRSTQQSTEARPVRMDTCPHQHRRV